MKLLVWTVLFVPCVALAEAPPRYDHFSDKHSKIACNDCHQRSKANAWGPVRFPKKDHRPCENSGCHPGELVKFDPRKPKYCRTCHLGGPGGRGIDIHKVAFPPHRKGEATQWGMAISGHKTHAESGKCEGCHKENAPVAGAPEMGFTEHAGCVSCHESQQKPSMSECTGCHQKKEASTAMLSAIASDFRVLKKFTHKSHAEKTGKNDCLSCHADAKVAKGERTPLPAMAECTGCHDGEQAFDALGSACLRCHQSATVSALAQPPPPQEMTFFSHARHSDRNVIGPNTYGCKDCHSSTERGRLWFPAGGKDFDPKKGRNGHWPCEKCHSNQFLTRDTKGICLVCHSHSDPWRSNSAKEHFRQEREMTTELPHDKHDKTACDRCHYEQSGAAKPAVAAGLLAPEHELCAQCHETHKTAPMKKCESCHRLKSAKQLGNKWTVDAKFSHGTHQIDVRTAQVVDTATIGWARVDRSTAKKLDCTACHLKIDSGENPKMQSCHACHDGMTAFKDTGFGCVRCHGPVEEKGS